MRIHVVVAPVFATNCCVVVADARPDAPPGTEQAGGGPRDCVVVDPGAGVSDSVSRLVEAENLVPRAVLATHGHADHTWDAAELCARYDVPFRLHAADAYRLDDPFGTLGIRVGPAVSNALVQALAGLGLHAEDYRTPGVVEPFEGAGGAVVAGDVVIQARHAPGHTEGSTLYVLDDARAGGPGEGSGVVLSGDVLFAGSIGRTDLPGGDPAVMQATLRDVVGALDPGLAVVPGHGPATTVRDELRTNPFLT